MPDDGLQDSIVYDFRDAGTDYSAYTPGWHEVDFGGFMGGQYVSNDGDATLEVSFDGDTVHLEVAPDASYAWSEHPRRVAWLRRKLGTGGGGAQPYQFAAMREDEE